MFLFSRVYFEMQSMSSKDEPLSLLKYVYSKVKDDDEMTKVFAAAGVTLNVNHYRLVDVFEKSRMPPPPGPMHGIKREVI